MEKIQLLLTSLLFGCYCLFFAQHASKVFARFLKVVSRLAGKELGALVFLSSVGAVRAIGILNLIFAIVFYSKLE